jgi:hypothetical protein
MDKLQRQIYFVRHDIWLVDGTLALLCTRVLCNEVLSSYLLGAQDRLSLLEASSWLRIVMRTIIAQLTCSWPRTTQSARRSICREYDPEQLPVRH